MATKKNTAAPSVAPKSVAPKAAPKAAPKKAPAKAVDPLRAAYAAIDNVAVAAAGGDPKVLDGSKRKAKAAAKALLPKA